MLLMFGPDGVHAVGWRSVGDRGMGDVCVLFAFSASYAGVSFLCNSRLFVLCGVVFGYFVVVCGACSFGWCVVSFTNAFAL